MTNLIIYVVNLLTWAATIVWTLLSVAIWLTAQESSAIHQCFGAARCAASVMVGYVIAKGITEILAMIKRIVNH